MNSSYVFIAAVVVVIVVACILEVLRLRTFLNAEKEKRLQKQAEKARLNIDSVISGFDEERRDLFALSPEYLKVKDEEKEIHDRLLKEALDKVYAEEQRAKKRLEQDAVMEIIRDVIRNFRHSVYQRVNQPKLKEAKAKKKFVSKNKASQEREKRSNREKEREQEKLRQEEQKCQEQEREQERQRQDEERRQKDEEKRQKEQQDKEQRQQQDVRQKIMDKRGVDTPESKSSKASEAHISEMEIKPEGISVSTVVSEAGKAAVNASAKASGGR